MVKALITDARLAEEMIARRQALGHDRWDEVWEGVWHMAPAPKVEHQRIATLISSVLLDAIGGSQGSLVLSQPNVADPEQGLRDFRVPDVVAILAGGQAQVLDSFVARPDFVVEVRSPVDETFEKLPWYAKQGVREVLVIDRDTKAPELYRLQDGALVKVASSPGAVESRVVPLRFERVEREGKPRLLVTHTGDPAKRWEI